MREAVKILIEPIKATWTELAEQANTTHLVIKLLNSSIRTPYYLNKLSESSIIDNETQALELKQLADESLILGKASSLILKGNSEYVLYPFLVSYWSVVECSFDDLMKRLIMNDENLNQKLNNAGIAIKSDLQVGTELWASEIYGKLGRKTRSKLEKEEGNVSEFEKHRALLKIFEINLEFDKNKAVHVEEFNQIRNCILHNQGVIDNKAANTCPSLKSMVGQKIRIDDETFVNCVDSVRDYTLSWIFALIYSPYLVDAMKKDSKNPYSA